MPAITKATFTGAASKLNTGLAGVPDHLLTVILLVAAAIIAYLSFKLPPAAKLALLAYIILP
jgi:hypothetical protein